MPPKCPTIFFRFAKKTDLTYSSGCHNAKTVQLQTNGGLAAHAAGSPTPVMGSRSALIMCPPPTKKTLTPDAPVAMGWVQNVTAWNKLSK